MSRDIKMRRSYVRSETFEKERQILQLRKAGRTFDEIAQIVGYATAQGAYAAYKRACQRIIRTDVIDIRNVEIDRLDAALNAIWQDVLDGDTTAIMAMLRISERRAKLLGLDTPVRVETKTELSIMDGNDIDREVQRLAELIDRGGKVSVDEQVGES